jgi:hypothetical protein
MNEVWKDVVGYEGLYQVSNLGRVKALERLVKNNGSPQHKHEKILKYGKTGRYLMVSLCKEGKVKAFTVHRLVAIAFIPNPKNKPNVDHIDTNCLNNCADNLRWVTQSENSMNPLTRKHLSESKIGHKATLLCHTEESKRKMSIIAKKRFNERKEN